MSSRRKIISAILVLVALLMLSGIATVKLLLNGERLASFARDRVEARLGRDLTIGEISLQFRPLPTLRIKNAVLGNAPWAKGSDFLQADRLTARLDLTSLLRGRIEIASLAIDGLSINLETSSDNRKNWQFESTLKSALPERENANASFASLPLANVHLTDMRIRYAKHGEPIQDWQVDALDAQTDSGWRNVRIGAELVRNDVPLRAKASFADLSGAGRAGAVSEGSVELFLGAARFAVTGMLPISGSLENHKIKLDFDARSAKELLGFFGFGDIDLAPIKASADLHDEQSAIQAKNLFFQIGQLKISGDATIHATDPKLHYRARLAVDHLDWTQMLRDFGRPPLPPKPPDQLFRDTPLGWRAIVALQAIDGKSDLRIQSVKLRSGIQLKDLKASVDTGEKGVRIEKFSFSMLDGSASGNLLLAGNKRSAKLTLEMNKVSLGKWLAARGHRLALTGGPMDLKASLSAAGLSMRDLAESLSGPVRISVGPAKLHSKQFQQAEGWLVGLAPIFSTNETDHVSLACMSAYLPFENGRAAAEPIAGIRSGASQMLGSGYFDLKRQTMDLRGRVRARSGVNLGVSNIAGGNLKIAGRIAAPGIGLDPESTPAALARIGAAIMTSGVSILATALWDAANPASDPCQITFSANEKRPASKPKNPETSEAGAHAN